jgi:hypothetical protein
VSLMNSELVVTRGDRDLAGELGGPRPPLRADSAVLLKASGTGRSQPRPRWLIDCAVAPRRDAAPAWQTRVSRPPGMAPCEEK